MCPIFLSFNLFLERNTHSYDFRVLRLKQSTADRQFQRCQSKTHRLHFRFRINQLHYLNTQQLYYHPILQNCSLRTLD